MNYQASRLDRLRRAFTNPDRGVLGLVDELLAVSVEQALRLTWRAGRCQVRFLDGASSDRVEVPMPKSAVRAVLARVAALCNERNPQSVSPHGGEGEVAIGPDPAATIRVSFVNTPESQQLALSTVGAETDFVAVGPKSCPPP